MSCLGIILADRPDVFLDVATGPVAQKSGRFDRQPLPKSTLRKLLLSCYLSLQRCNFGRGWRIPQYTLSFGDVSDSMSLIAWAGGREGHTGRLSEQLLQDSSHSVNGHNLAPAEVVYLTNTLHPLLKSQYDALHTSSNKGVATTLLAVSINDNWFIVEQSPNENMARHIGTLAWAIHRKESQHR
jgi:hypothetical protein